MFQPARRRPNWQRALRGPVVFVALLLAVEFLDELVFGVREAAWPLIRTDLNLSYAQIGLLLGLPNLLSALVEPVFGVLADTWKRWLLVVGGGLCFTLAAFLTGLSPNFALLLLSFLLFYPASGAFVSLSQATLMDLEPSRHEHLMARWTLAGSLGVVGGPLLLGVAALLGVNWRGVFIGLGAVSLLLTLLVWRQPRLRTRPAAARAEQSLAGGLWAGLRQAAAALRRKEVLRWLVLLEFSDFMLDILLGFLALYMVDVAGVTPVLAAAAVSVWSIAGLLSDALIIPLLERVPGLTYLRWSAAVMTGLFIGFLLAPGYPAKLVLLALMGLANAGWYAILQGRLYSALPGQSGTAVAVGAAFSLVTGLVPATLGWLAQTLGLSVTMWLLLLGPVVVFLGLPRLTIKTSVL
ncbi:MAG: MFS transporter [Anaerolineales bacterium]|nr:MFS transporter [Anaerolineales bacterium]